MTLFVAFGFLSITDKFLYMVSEWDSVKENKSLLNDVERKNAILFDKLEEKQNTTSELLERLPSLFAGRHDVVTFSNANDSMNYCVAVTPLAIEVKNTVLRYGLTSSVSPSGSLYDSWLRAKRTSLGNNKCVWTEIVSAHFIDDDPQRVFMKNVGSGTSKYTGVFIDDKKHTIVQMTIFTFTDGHQEMLLGHEFLEMRHGPSFLTRNTEMIKWFENCFVQWKRGYGKNTPSIGA